MRYRYYTTDVFTQKLFGGNQLAVFPHAEGLDSNAMRLVSRELNFTETVFVFPPQDPNNFRHLRVFTPSTELPYAGHPTIGTVFVLATIGEIPLEGDSVVITLEETVGIIKSRIRLEEGKPVFTEIFSSMKPIFGPHPPEKEILARVLSLKPEDMLEGDLTPQAVSCGVPFLFIPVKNLNALHRAHLNLEFWEKYLADFWAPHLFVLTFNTENEAIDLRSRVFAPGMAISEDPASGSAATALGGYLGMHDPTLTGTLHWTDEQGVEMGRPCLMEVEADKVDGVVVSTRVGGSCVLVSEGLINIATEKDTRFS